MSEAKRYKLFQDVCYDDGAFVIPAGQVMVREVDYDTLRDERDRLREALEQVLEQWVNGRKVKDGICMEVLIAARAALTPAAGGTRHG